MSKSSVFFQAEDGIRDSDRDWSSDVCSSDLPLPILEVTAVSVDNLVANYTAAVEAHAAAGGGTDRKSVV